MNNKPLLSAYDIHKSFFQGDAELPILKGLSLDVMKGDAVCIEGASGAGKSTFLHILGTLDRPTQGRVIFEGQDLVQQGEEQLADFRNRSTGFVFQFHHLLNEFTALENVAMPMRIGGASAREARFQAEELLSIMGLAQRKLHYPSQLSGGEKQRVAIARALVKRPALLMADEPTGNLDTENGRRIHELFFELREKMGLTLIVVTHDTQFAALFPRSLKLQDGAWADSLKPH